MTKRRNMAGQRWSWIRPSIRLASIWAWLTLRNSSMPRLPTSCNKPGPCPTIVRSWWPAWEPCSLPGAKRRMLETYLRNCKNCRAESTSRRRLLRRFLQGSTIRIKHSPPWKRPTRRGARGCCIVFRWIPDLTDCAVRLDSGIWFDEQDFDIKRGFSRGLRELRGWAREILIRPGYQCLRAHSRNPRLNPLTFVFRQDPKTVLSIDS